MPRLGLLETAGLAVTVALVAPLALFGAQYLIDGRPLGAVFVAIAAGVVAAQHWLTTPGDLPAALLERLVGRTVEVPDEERDR